MGWGRGSRARPVCVFSRIKYQKYTCGIDRVVISYYFIIFTVCCCCCCYKLAFNKLTSVYSVAKPPASSPPRTSLAIDRQRFISQLNYYNYYTILHTHRSAADRYYYYIISRLVLFCFRRYFRCRTGAVIYLSVGLFLWFFSIYTHNGRPRLVRPHAPARYLVTHARIIIM